MLALAGEGGSDSAGDERNHGDGGDPADDLAVEVAPESDEEAGAEDQRGDHAERGRATLLRQGQHDPAEGVDDDAEAEGGQHRELGGVGEALADLAVVGLVP